MIKDLLAYSLGPFVLLGLKVKAKTGSTVKAIWVSILSFILCGTMWSLILMDDNSTNSAQVFDLNNQILESQKEISQLKEELKEAKKEAPKEVKKKAPKKEAKKSYTFGSGNFTAGEDFAPGTYDLIAVSGRIGNISTSDYSLNAIMGVGSEFAEKRYDNVELKKGVTLKIDGVKIRLE